MKYLSVIGALIFSTQAFAHSVTLTVPNSALFYNSMPGTSCNGSFCGTNSAFLSDPQIESVDRDGVVVSAKASLHPHTPTYTLHITCVGYNQQNHVVPLEQTSRVKCHQSGIDSPMIYEYFTATLYLPLSFEGERKGRSILAKSHGNPSPVNLEIIY